MAALALLPLLTGGCIALKLGVPNHAGPVAEQQWHLYTIVGVILVFVVGPVLILTPIIAWHYRSANRHQHFRPDWNFSWPLEGFIWIPPAGIVIGLGFLLWNYTHDLDPYKPLASDQPPIEVQAVAFDWKWLFIYPDQHIASVNQLAIPVGRSVHISLTSGTVMQSMLIPRLAGQIYAMAGMRTQLNLAASQPGRFRGQNTQYNGDGFAFEKFDVLALRPDDYQRWIERVRTDGKPFGADTMNRLFAKSVAPKPLFYNAVPDRTFAAVMARSTKSGPHE